MKLQYDHDTDIEDPTAVFIHIHYMMNREEFQLSGKKCKLYIQIRRNA